MAQQLLTELAIHPENKGFSLKEGVIRHKGRVWVGTNTTAQRDILIALHDSGVGHFGINATYARVKQVFSWPGLKQTVQDFCAAMSSMPTGKNRKNQVT